MKKLSLMSLIILLILSFSLTSVFAEKPLVLNLALVMPPDSDKNRCCIKFAELVQNKTDGMIQVEIFPAGQLGNEEQIAQGVQMGSVELAFVASEMYSSYVPELAVFGTPLIITSDEKWDAVMWSPIVDKMVDKLTKVAGVRIIGRWWMDQRFILTTKKPVYTPADLAGLKIRVPQMIAYTATIEALGATPTPIPYDSVYMALSQGVIDGMENPSGLIRSMKFYEVCKYLTKVPILNSLAVLVINESTFQQLTPIQKEILIEAANEAGEYLSKIITEERQDNFNFFEEQGMKIIEVESFEPWLDKIKDFPEKYNEIWGGDVDLYYQILNFEY